MIVDILAFGVHPDDIELSCSGTILKHRSLGKTVAAVDLTRGELGTRGNPELRIKEAEEAAKILGLRFRRNLGMKDGFFIHSEENLRKIIVEIRSCCPQIVLANAISDRHPDHGRAAKLVAEACFYSGLRKVKTQLNGEEQSPWRPSLVCHYIQDFYIEPDIVVDVTEFIDQKMASIMAFKSQFFNPDAREPETPISSMQFLDFLKGKMRSFGRPAGFEFAEGFTIQRYIGVTNLFDIK